MTTTWATSHGLEVAWCSGGYDTRDGYRVRGDLVESWHRKSDAVMAARMAAPGFTAQPAHTRFARHFWVLHNDQGGGFLTHTGWDQARARWTRLRMTPGVRPVKGLRVDGDAATGRQPQANGDVRYPVYRVLPGGLLAAETVLFIDRDRWERHPDLRYKTFLAGVWQTGGFTCGGSYSALQVGFGPTLATAMAHAHLQFAAQPVGALDAHPTEATS
jgi:hypothetical protein